MFSIVEKNQFLVKVILSIIVLSFVLWGIGSYLNMFNKQSYIVQVGHHKIYDYQVEQVIQQNPQLRHDRKHALDVLINRQLLLAQIRHIGLTVSDEDIRNKIISMPSLQQNHTFSYKKYKDLLHNNGISATYFENSTRQQLLLQQLSDLFKQTFFTSAKVKQFLVNRLSEQRIVKSYTFKLHRFHTRVSSKEVRSYYKIHTADFMIPEKFQLQYLLLSPNTIIAQVSKNEELKYIAANYLRINKVKASHILLNVPQNASYKQIELIRQRALSILAKTKHDKFSVLAKKYSDDKGSSIHGGDLGYFGHGMMVPEFEKAAFALKKNQISGLVRTKFGFHIIKLTGIKYNTLKVAMQIAHNKLSTQKALIEIPKKLVILTNNTYSVHSNLKSVAKQLKVKLVTTKLLTQQQLQESKFMNSKAIKTIHDADILTQHLNSTVFKLGKDKYVVFKVLKHTKAILPPLVKVKKKIIHIINTKKKIALANQKAVKYIKLLQHSRKLKLHFHNKQTVKIFGNQHLRPDLVKKIMNPNIHKFPFYINYSNESSSSIYKVISEHIDKQSLKNNVQLIDANINQSYLTDIDWYAKHLRQNFRIQYYKH